VDLGTVLLIELPDAVEDVVHLRLVDPVVDVHSVAAILNDAATTHPGQVLRDGSLRKIEFFLNVRDGRLPFLEYLNDLQTLGMSKRTNHFRAPIERVGMNVFD